jgi:hypothetical protein
MMAFLELTRCEIVLLCGGAVVAVLAYIIGYCNGRRDEYNDFHTGGRG